MADGSVRDEIAAALWGWQSGNHGARTIVTDGQALDFAERVLPVVERLQRQAAAEAVRQIADELAPHYYDSEFVDRYVGELRDRADDLDPS